MRLDQPFDATEDYGTCAPAGWYTAVIRSLSPHTSQNNEKALKLTLELVDHEYAGLRVYYYYNYFHSDPKVAKVAKQQLQRLCQHLDIAVLHDTEEVTNKLIDVELGEETWNETKMNKVVALRRTGGTTEIQSRAPERPAERPAPTAAPSGNGRANW